MASVRVLASASVSLSVPKSCHTARARASSAASGARPIASICSIDITLPSGCEDPPEGRGACGQSSAVAENGIFRLTSRRHFGEDQDCQILIFPGFAGHVGPPLVWRAFVFLGLG